MQNLQKLSKSRIDWLMTDDDYYKLQVRIARGFVEEHISCTVHATRLRK